jgi:hypothetical protein
LSTPEKTSRSVTHPEIALGQARLTSEFFSIGVPEKKVYLDGMSILSIILSLESGCHALDRVGNKIKEVEIGVAIPGHVFHNNPIPVEYAKVLVHEITYMSYIDYPLDHVTPKGVRELGEAINQFILWNRREIVLDGPASPQNQLMSPLSQTVTPKDKEAPLPRSPPSVPRFKEASLLSSTKEKEASPLPTSPVKVMPHKELGHQEQDLPPSSPYNIIYQELGIYNPNTRSDPTNKFFEVMKK